MTEQEIKENKEWLEDFIRAFSCNFDDLEKKSFDEIVVCLRELEQYRALGTVEELRVARDKQVAKKPSKDEFDRYICPDCGWIVYTDEYGGRYLLHCENCGQKLNWEEV